MERLYLKSEAMPDGTKCVYIYLYCQDKKTGKTFWKRLINIPITDFNNSYSIVEPVKIMVGYWDGDNNSNYRDASFPDKTDTDSIPDMSDDSVSWLH